jgi:hypothetical protein
MPPTSPGPLARLHALRLDDQSLALPVQLLPLAAPTRQQGESAATSASACAAIQVVDDAFAGRAADAVREAAGFGRLTLAPEIRNPPIQGTNPGAKILSCRAYMAWWLDSTQRSKELFWPVQAGHGISDARPNGSWRDDDGAARWLLPRLPFLLPSSRCAEKTTRTQVLLQLGAPLEEALHVRPGTPLRCAPGEIATGTRLERGLEHRNPPGRRKQAKQPGGSRLVLKDLDPSRSRPRDTSPHLRLRPRRSLQIRPVRAGPAEVPGTRRDIPGALHWRLGSFVRRAGPARVLQRRGWRERCVDVQRNRVQAGRGEARNGSRDARRPGGWMLVSVCAGVHRAFIRGHGGDQRRHARCCKQRLTRRAFALPAAANAAGRVLSRRRQHVSTVLGVCRRSKRVRAIWIEGFFDSETTTQTQAGRQARNVF